MAALVDQSHLVTPTAGSFTNLNNALSYDGKNDPFNKPYR